MNRLATGLAGLLMGTAVALVTATPAAAHSSLAGSSPADQAALAQAPTEVTLTFNEPVSTQFVDVVVTGPDGAAHQDGAAAVAGDTVTQSLETLAEDGQYSIAYRVVSADGHPISGELRFSLTLPVPTTSAAPPASTSGASDPPAATSSPLPSETTVVATSDDRAEEGGSGALPLVVGLVVAVGVLGGAAAWLSRRRTAGGG